MQLAAETSHFPLLAAFGTVTWGERTGAKTRVRGINLAAGTGAWAIGLQAWEGTREIPAATTNSWWDASSFGFTGREHDLGSGLVYARDRYLSSATGRWTQADRFVAAHDKAWDVTTTANLHVYAYVGQSPTGFVDPLGQIRIPTTVEASVFRMIVRGAYQAKPPDREKCPTDASPPNGRRATVRPPDFAHLRPCEPCYASAQ